MFKTSEDTMSEFIYVAANRSMPGLIKVGRTKRIPSTRMQELQTTGVPTPFSLCLVLRVPDSKAAEYAAHQALCANRVSESREFFRVEIADAIELILNSQKTYEIDWDFTDNTVSKAALEKYLYDQLDKLETERQDLTRVIIQRPSQIHRLQSERQNLLDRRQALGSPPAEKPVAGGIFRIAWWPIPFGWMFWAGGFRFLTEGRLILSGIFFSCIAIGGLVSRKAIRDKAAWERASQPWIKVNQELENLDALVEAVESQNRKLSEIRKSIDSVTASLVRRFPKVKRYSKILEIGPATSVSQDASVTAVIDLTGLTPDVFMGADFYQLQGGVFAVAISDSLYLYESEELGRAAVFSFVHEGKPFSNVGLVGTYCLDR